MNARWFAGLLVLLAIGFALIIATSEYKRRRILGFWDPWGKAQDEGYQLTSNTQPPMNSHGASSCQVLSGTRNNINPVTTATPM